jgi:hypothetical protein
MGLWRKLSVTGKTVIVLSCTVVSQGLVFAYFNFDLASVATLPEIKK